ncbi:MAG: enoyl-CoA hydratase-related protein [Thermaerobacter sp.]|nr:enoyl-CoA hydratase-related protein [Thermaerobacter sp.]
MELLHTERVDHVMLWTMNHPPVNAISFDLLTALAEALDQAESDPSIRAVVLAGQPHAFAAGADISGFVTLGGRIQDFLAAGVTLFERIERGTKPVVAAIEGVALGGGNELAMACDVRVAGPDARFGQPEVNLGIIPGWGGTVRLPRLIGRSRAAGLLLTGNAMDSAEAYRVGLVGHLAETGLVIDYAMNVAERLASLPPLALAAIKRLLAAPDGDLQSLETEAMKQLMATADATEGIMAFMEKRRPRFQGR